MYICIYKLIYGFGINYTLQVYIVHFAKDINGEKALHEIEETHHSYLLSVKDNAEDARASLLYSYKHSINGFSALLTPDEASKLSSTYISTDLNH